MIEVIDSYRYSNFHDRDRMNLYEKYSFNKSEKEKTKSLRKKIIEFEKTVNNEDRNIGIEYYPQERIKYYNDIGYISLVNGDRDIVDVYYYGSDENEALINAMIDYEFSITSRIEIENKKAKTKENNISENNYHEPSLYAELSIKDFKKYFGDSIPKRIIKYYEDYLNKDEGINYKYDYEINNFILQK